MTLVADNAQAQTNKVSDADKVKMAILATLAELGGLTVSDDDILFSGEKIILPESYEGRVSDAVEYLEAYVKGQEKHYDYSQTFNYRPWDGANAFNEALKETFGTTGLGKTTYDFFGGAHPPQLVTVSTGVGTTVQVPWGKVEFPPLEATFVLDSTRSREYGMLFTLHVEAPKKYRKHIQAFFDVVEKKLKERSIYKGKAITGGEEPLFLDTTKLDPKTVVYSEEVFTQLDANLWSLVDHTDIMRELKIPLKRAVLLEGPYGTGKTLAGMLTAQHAVANNWTFILCRTGQDDLYDVLKTAQLYAPAVVWYEDIDTVARGGDHEAISRLLDALDGVTTKGGQVVAGFTTNFVDQIQKAVLRPGRLDAVIHIGELDESGFRKLIQQLVPKHLLGDIDYELVGKAYAGFLPAFATEATSRALRYSVARNHGKPDVISTDDLVNAALGLRPQLELMSGAKEGADVPTIDRIVKDLVVDGIDHARFTDDTNYNTGLRYDPEREFDD
jgi:transitional endoplasmic reticulum ATPase